MIYKSQFFKYKSIKLSFYIEFINNKKTEEIFRFYK